MRAAAGVRRREAAACYGKHTHHVGMAAHIAKQPGVAIKEHGPQVLGCVLQYHIPGGIAMHRNITERAMLVKRIVDERYQPQSHKGSMLDIYRNHVVKIYPMSQQTFYRYMHYAIGVDGYIGNGTNRVMKDKIEGMPMDDDRQLYFLPYFHKCHPLPGWQLCFGIHDPEVFLHLLGYGNCAAFVVYGSIHFGGSPAHAVLDDLAADGASELARADKMGRFTGAFVRPRITEERALREVAVELVGELHLDVL